MSVVGSIGWPAISSALVIHTADGLSAFSGLTGIFGTFTEAIAPPVFILATDYLSAQIDAFALTIGVSSTSIVQQTATS